MVSKFMSTDFCGECSSDSTILIFTAVLTVSAGYIEIIEIIRQIEKQTECWGGKIRGLRRNSCATKDVWKLDYFTSHTDVLFATSFCWLALNCTRTNSYVTIVPATWNVFMHLSLISNAFLCSYRVRKITSTSFLFIFSRSLYFVVL